jgi:iron complex outermembrane receptor protein
MAKAQRSWSTAYALKRLLASTCLAGMAALSQPALAQNEAGNQQDDERPAEGIDEIVVTARYIAESIQDTPIAITAQTQEQLEAANVTNIGGLGAVVPNLHTVPGDSQSAGTPVISLRGVQQGFTSSLAVPPAVAIYTDDVYHSTTAGSELDFTDVARIEVSRGPQSTLSGNASIAGSIKLFTEDPKGDGSGYVEAGYGSRNHMEGAGVIDLGLSDTLAMRVLGHYDRQRGFGNRLDFACMMDKLGTPELKGTLPYFQPDSAKKGCVIGHTGGGTTAVGQVKLLWEPTSDISLLLTARHREDDLEETPEVTLGFGNACVQPVAGYPNGIGQQPCRVGGANQTYYLATWRTFGVLPDNRFLTPERNGGTYDTYATNCRPLLDKSGVVGTSRFPANYPDGLCYEPRKRANHTLGSARLTAGLTDHINMTAIGAYTKYDNEFTQNGDQSPLGVVISHFINKDEMWSGELRFDGGLLDDRLTWVLGAFAAETDGYQNNMISFVNIFQISSVHGVNTSKSAFAHLGFNITDRWRVSGGGRYSDTEIAITIDNPQATSITEPVVSGDKRWDWLLSTDYQVTDDILVYVSAATGSRPPGLTTILVTPRQLQPTSAEELISYEGGVKADLFDRRLRTNLTAFYMDYKKLATSVAGTECRNQPGPVATWFNVAQGDPAALGPEFCGQFPGTPAPITFFNNVGIPATVKGIEWEISALPIDGLRLDWTGGYNKFESSVEPPNPGSYAPGNLRQPEWGMHASASYELQTGIGTITPKLIWSWQSRQTYDTTPQVGLPEPIFVIEPYSIWNAQLAYEMPDGDWSAVLQVNNLTDKYYHYQVLRGSVNSQTRVAAPREWMLTLRRDF